MKKVLFLAVISLALFSARGIYAQADVNAKSADTEYTIVTPENFQDFAAENVGKGVEIKGMVVHVCRHGGKKMFIIGEDPEQRVKIDASDKVNVFDPVLEGSVVSVKGIIQPIEEEVVPEAEKAAEDADHKNYYHKPQYAISCMAMRTVEE